jgi:ribosomal protein S18 acetylase RimI-like enzyme
MEGYFCQMIEYSSEISSLSPADLKDFFVEFTNKPSLVKRLQILKNSDYVIIAKEGEKLVGFINAVSDKTFSAYIPLLEVLHEYRGNGIGSELVKQMLDMLKNYYMIDICCDESLEKFYKKFNMLKLSAMVLRNYDKI